VIAVGQGFERFRQQLLSPLFGPLTAHYNMKSREVISADHWTSCETRIIGLPLLYSAISYDLLYTYTRSDRMNYLTLIVAFLPSILAEPIGYKLKVNLLTSIPDLIMNAPHMPSTSYNSVAERRMYENDILSVVGDMVFTESDKSQEYNVSFGGHWSGVVSL
jgi:hypothetical protein